MNKNKIIFLIIGAIVCILTLIIVSLLNSDGKKVVNLKNDINIWTVGHNVSDFSELIAAFTEQEGNGGISFEHRNFDSLSDYQSALLYELANGSGPDIFMLNNSERLLLEDSVAGVDPSYIDPDSFRKNFLPIFGEELIAQTSNPDKPDTNIDFIIGVPAGFETLGLFYDRRSFIGKDLKTLSGLSSAISDIKDKNSQTIPVGIGHGTTVYDSHNIFSQFLINAGSTAISDLDPTAIRNALSNYLVYGDTSDDNGYNSVVTNLQKTGRDNISLFSSGDIKMLIGYPSMLEKIKDSGFSQSFLIADPFPKSGGTSDKLMIDYNYFVINNYSDHLTAASKFLSYLASTDGLETYYTIFTQRIPSYADVVNHLDTKIDENYNIIYRNFLRTGAQLITYNRGIRVLFDSHIPRILDNESIAANELSQLQALLQCRVNTIVGKSGQNITCQ